MKVLCLMRGGVLVHLARPGDFAKFAPYQHGTMSCCLSSSMASVCMILEFFDGCCVSVFGASALPLLSLSEVLSSQMFGASIVADSLSFEVSSP